MSSTPTEDPAIRSYFFGKGYQDLSATIAESWQRNMDSAKEFFDKAPGGDDPGELFQSGVWIAAGISTLIFGTVFFAVASTIHIVLLCLFFLLVYIGFTVLWLMERAYLAVRSFFMACPHCYARSTIPEYLCDGCGAVHARLLPNSYGITSHICECGKKLPATFFLDRGHLQARCPSCRQNIAREHVESRRIFVPIMGGPSTGKSAFLFGAVRQLVEHEANNLGFKAELFDKRSEGGYRSVVGMLQAGRPPDKTRDPIPRAFNLSLYKNGRLAFLLYLYDPAGEAYQEADKLAAHGFHDYLSGMVLVVDPFAIPAVCAHYASELKRELGLLKPSELPIEEAVDRLLLTLEENFGLSKKGRVKQPLAVVVNKVDAFDLEDVIGESAVDRALAPAAGDNPVDRDAVRNKMLKNQLVDWGEQAFVSRIEGRFSNVRYFSCSALGRMPDGSGAEFTANAVLPPLLWIFGHADRASFADSANGNGARTAISPTLTRYFYAAIGVFVLAATLIVLGLNGHRFEPLVVRAVALIQELGYRHQARTASESARNADQAQHDAVPPRGAKSGGRVGQAGVPLAVAGSMYEVYGTVSHLNIRDSAPQYRTGRQRPRMGRDIGNLTELTRVRKISETTVGRDGDIWYEVEVTSGRSLGLRGWVNAYWLRPVKR